MDDDSDESEVGRVNIVVEELGPGWFVLRAILPSDFQRQVELDRLPGLIDRTLIHYLRSRPERKVRATMPLIEDGYTTIVHVWFDDSEE